MNASMQTTTVDLGALREILRSYEDKEGALIPVLQDTQEAYGYLSREALEAIARALHISPAQIYAVASFYAQFRFQPQGKHVMCVCVGTACHVRGSSQILLVLENELGVASGETTPDGLFTLEEVACQGACALAPTMALDGEPQGKMTIAKTRRLVKKLRESEAAGGES